MTTVVWSDPSSTSTSTRTVAADDASLTVAVSVVISYLAYSLTNHLVPFLAKDLVDKGLRGRDMLKPGFKKKDDDDVEHEAKWMRVLPGSVSSAH